MTPDNAGYAIAAYLLTALVYAAYIVSIRVRERRLRSRLQALGAATGHPDSVERA